MLCLKLYFDLLLCHRNDSQKFKKWLQKKVCTHESLKSVHKTLKSDYKKLKSAYKNLKMISNFLNTFCRNGAPYILSYIIVPWFHEDIIYLKVQSKQLFGMHRSSLRRCPVRKAVL